MKRRSFIKMLAAALLSPFLPSGSPSAEIAIRDPAIIGYSDKIILDQTRDQRIGTRIISGRPVCFNSKDYGVVAINHYSGDQWTELQRAQFELNKRRSLVLNRIITK